MRIGANTWIWTSPFGTDNLELVHKVKSLGFDVIEVAVEDLALIDAAALKGALQETGLEPALCGAFGPERDIGSDAPARRETGLRYIRDCLALAQQIGATRFAGPVNAVVGDTRLRAPDEIARRRAHVVENLRILGYEAAERGVVICLEPLNRFETDMVNTAEQAVELIEQVGNPNVQIHLDTFHMNIEEKHLPAAIRRAGQHLHHFHACGSDRGIVGADHTDWAGIRDALRDVGYDGLVVIESFTPGVKEIARAAAIWRPLAPTQDALAAESLRYLRELFAS